MVILPIPLVVCATFTHILCGVASLALGSSEITARELHYIDVIMRGDGIWNYRVSIVYSTVCSGVDQRKHQRSASLTFVRGIHPGPVESPHKGPVTRKMFPVDDDIMNHYWYTQPATDRNNNDKTRTLCSFCWDVLWVWCTITWLITKIYCHKDQPCECSM